MATLTIRQLDDRLKQRLRVRAAHNGRSMEEEAREILRGALAASKVPEKNLAELIRERFAPFGGVELNIPKRQSIKKPPDFS
jgi:plasmid stability protein